MHVTEPTQQLCEIRSIRIFGLQVTEMELANLSQRESVGKTESRGNSAPSH